MTGPQDIRVGTRIRQRRWMLGLRRQQLASQMGVWPELLEAWESGRRRIGGCWLSSVAAALEVPVAYLFEDPAAPEAGLAPCPAANAPDRPSVRRGP